MATNSAIDPELPDRALPVGGDALEEPNARREQAKIVQHFGTLDWDPRYDHKADRRSRDEKLEARR